MRKNYLLFATRKRIKNFEALTAWPQTAGATLVLLQQQYKEQTSWMRPEEQMKYGLLPED